jgi:hypothetical protein
MISSRESALECGGSASGGQPLVTDQSQAESLLVSLRFLPASAPKRCGDQNLLPAAIYAAPCHISLSSCVALRLAASNGRGRSIGGRSGSALSQRS